MTPDNNDRPGATVRFDLTDKKLIQRILDSNGYRLPESENELIDALNEVLLEPDTYDRSIINPLLSFLLLAYPEYKTGSRTSPFNSVLGLKRKKASLLDSRICIGEPIGNIYLDHRLNNTSKQTCIEAYIEHLHIERALAYQVYQKAHQQLNATADKFTELAHQDKKVIRD